MRTRFDILYPGCQVVASGAVDGGLLRSVAAVRGSSRDAGRRVDTEWCIRNEYD